MKYITLALLWILIPTTAHAAVYITEVAWMGTTESQYSEWLELYNNGESSVNLSGWKLYEGDGTTLVFTFTKSIVAGGYILLERTTASAPDAVAGINDESGSFGGGGFANTGEHLVLKDTTGEMVDELNFLDGWPAGDVTTKQTMQLKGDKWITAEPTPRTPTGNSSDTEDTYVDDTSPTKDKQTDPSPIPKVSPNKPQIMFTIPTTLYRGVSYTFVAEPVLEYSFRVHTGYIYWNFGDGTIVRQQEVAPLVHTYMYPGTYTLYYSYTDNKTKSIPLVGTKKIKIVDPTLTLTMIDNRAVELSNTTATAVDLSGWKLIANGKTVDIPESTIISEKSKITIPFISLGIISARAVVLINPSGTIVAQTDTSPSIPRMTKAPRLQEVIREISSDSLVADASVVRDIEAPAETPIRKRTKTIIFGAVALFVIGLSILLERVMARREY